MSANGRNEEKTLEDGLLIVISGPSGAGKGTICRELLKRDDNLALSVSATTRAKGANEIFGKDYFFYSDEKFQDLVDHDGFLEWAEVHGKRYGTLKNQVEEIMNAGKDCILEIDVQGGLQVYEKMPESCITIFVKAPSEEELIRRITARNREKPEEIKRRMLTARWEMTREEKYQYTVVNDQLEEVVDRVLEIIREERSSHATTVHR
jgi:guanylate kinase